MLVQLVLGTSIHGYIYGCTDPTMSHRLIAAYIYHLPFLLLINHHFLRLDFTPQSILHRLPL